MHSLVHVAIILDMAYGDSAIDRLARVRATIDQVLEAQAMGSSGRQITLASLSELRKMEVSLIEEVNQANQGGAVCSVMAQVPTT